MTGSLVNRAKHPKKWSLVLDLGYQADPKTGKLRRRQKWIKFHGTKREAQAKLAELVTAKHGDTFVEPSKLTVTAWLRKWLDTSVKPMKSPATYELYRITVERHVATSPLGALPLQQVRPTDVERYLAELKVETKTGVPSASTVEQHYAVLSGAFKRAVRDRLLTATPLVAVERKRPPRDDASAHARAACWNVEETRAVLKAAAEAGTQASAFFALGLDAGARKGELLGLAWSHLDLEAGTVTIERTITSRRGAPTYGPTKTKDRRVLDLDPDTVARLKAHRSAQAEVKMKNRQSYADHGLVFAKESPDLVTVKAKLGDPMTGVLDGRTFRAIVAAANVRPITPHGMRHTVATLMLQGGVPVHEVAARLGHAKASMTLDTYAHAQPRKGLSARSAMGC